MTSHKKKSHSKKHKKHSPDSITNEEHQALIQKADQQPTSSSSTDNLPSARLGIQLDLQANKVIEVPRDDHPVLPVVGEVIAYTTFALLIFTLFLTLKLDHYLEWTWWLICSPLWYVLPCYNNYDYYYWNRIRIISGFDDGEIIDYLLCFLPSYSNYSTPQPTGHCYSYCWSSLNRNG